MVSSFLHCAARSLVHVHLCLLSALVQGLRFPSILDHRSASPTIGRMGRDHYRFVVPCKDGRKTDWPVEEITSGPCECTNRHTALTNPLAFTRRRLPETVTEYRHMRKLLIVAALLFMALPAQAAMQCGDRDSLLKVLSDKYKELPLARALSLNGTAMFEIYTSEAGTWTMIVTNTAGVTCIVAAGQSWESIPQAFGEPA